MHASLAYSKWTSSLPFWKWFDITGYTFNRILNLFFIYFRKLSACCTKIAYHHAYTFWYIFIRVTPWWARWRLKSPAFRSFAQTSDQAQIKQNIKAPRHWPLWGEFCIGDLVTGGFPSQRASDAENVSIWLRLHEQLLFQMLTPSNTFVT